MVPDRLLAAPAWHLVLPGQPLSRRASLRLDGRPVRPDVELQNATLGTKLLLGLGLGLGVYRRLFDWSLAAS